jgi:hypothetical protein
MTEIVDPDEVARRERYWFANWRDFTCDVVVAQPHDRTLRLGMFTDGLFGSIPIPFHGQEIDRGPFHFYNDRMMIVTGRRTTFCWPIGTPVILLDDGVEIRRPNQPVITVRGPVRAAIAGAYTELRLPVEC